MIGHVLFWMDLIYCLVPLKSLFVDQPLYSTGLWMDLGSLYRTRKSCTLFCWKGCLRFERDRGRLCLHICISGWLKCNDFDNQRYSLSLTWPCPAVLSPLALDSTLHSICLIKRLAKNSYVEDNSLAGWCNDFWDDGLLSNHLCSWLQDRTSRYALYWSSHNDQCIFHSQQYLMQAWMIAIIQPIRPQMIHRREFAVGVINGNLTCCRLWNLLQSRAGPDMWVIWKLRRKFPVSCITLATGGASARCTS